jgi:hypothetical protein
MLAAVYFHMRLRDSFAVLILGFSGPGASQSVPQIVYGTDLGGQFKECTSGIAVDRSGNAYVVGHTPSPDFPGNLSCLQHHSTGEQQRRRMEQFTFQVSLNLRSGPIFV